MYRSFMELCVWLDYFPVRLHKLAILWKAEARRPSTNAPSSRGCLAKLFQEVRTTFRLPDEIFLYRHLDNLDRSPQLLGCLGMLGWLMPDFHRNFALELCTGTATRPIRSNSLA